jgi:hypothetical protein
MKLATPLSRGLLSRLFSVLVMPFGLAGFGLLGQAHAVAVDKELVLLVDVSQSGLNKKDFDSLLGSYASAFSSSQVLNSIQSGQYGRIAVSLMLYGGPAVQQVGIPWMSIANASDAAVFTSRASSVNKPNAAGFPAVSTALAAASASFGTETGRPSNGFESSLQIIDVVAAVEPNVANAAGDAAARTGAMTSGVDIINSIAVGNKATAIAAYFSTNVIGSNVPGVLATSSSAGAINAALTQSITNSLAVNITAVPEPSSALALLLGGCLLLVHRRRA